MREVEVAIYCDQCFGDNGVKHMAHGEVTVTVGKLTRTIAYCGEHEQVSLPGLANYLQAYGTTTKLAAPTKAKPVIEVDLEPGFVSTDEKLHLCPFKGCKQSFDTERAMRAHHTKKHGPGPWMTPDQIKRLKERYASRGLRYPW